MDTRKAEISLIKQMFLDFLHIFILEKFHQIKFGMLCKHQALQRAILILIAF